VNESTDTNKQNELVSDGRAAFEGYRAKAEGVSLVRGDVLPPWENLPAKITDAWETAAAAAIANHDANHGGTDANSG
jgi:hypothetical protein